MTLCALAGGGDFFLVVREKIFSQNVRNLIMFVINQIHLRALRDKYSTPKSTFPLNFVFIQVIYCGIYKMLLREQSTRILLLIPFETIQINSDTKETKS